MRMVSSVTPSSAVAGTTCANQQTMAAAAVNQTFRLIGIPPFGDNGRWIDHTGNIRLDRPPFASNSRWIENYNRCRLLLEKKHKDVSCQASAGAVGSRR